MSEQSVLKLDYETPHFLLSLYAGDEANLRYLEEALNIKVITRDGWITFKGSGEAINTAKQLFEDLEKVQRNSGIISSRDFKKALDLMAQNSDQSLSTLNGLQLVGGRGKKPVVAKSPRQLDYIKKMLEHDVVFGLGPAGTGKTYRRERLLGFFLGTFKKRLHLISDHSMMLSLTC